MYTSSNHGFGTVWANMMCVYLKAAIDIVKNCYHNCV